MVGKNREIIRLLDELATLTEIDEGSPNAFRVRAYQNAKRGIETLSRDVATMDAAELAMVKGIGKSIAARIREFVDTGRVARLEELRAKHPSGKLELMRVPGLGPKSVQLLDEQIGVTDLAGLTAALDDGRIATLPGMGEKTVANLRLAIERLGLGSKDQRVPIGIALPLAERAIAVLAKVDGVHEVGYAGSLRRFREDVGDIDLLVATDDPTPVHEALVGWGEVARTLGSGETKTSVVTHDQVQIDLRVVPPESFGAAMLYFTGSKAHNIRLRQVALARGWTLNEYALAEQRDDDDERAPDQEKESEASRESGNASDVRTQAPRTGPTVASVTERDIYGALGLDYVAPEMREDVGEIEAAKAATSPTLVTVDDLRGDLHDHTDLSGDGRDSLQDMVAAAHHRGLEYLAITDHAEDLRINGVSREGMLEQREQIRRLEEERGDIRLLHGAELNIGVDGSLDYDAEFLATFDWLVASVHSHFSRDVAEQTARVIAAMRHPSVTAIGHLTGRRIGSRPGIALAMDQVLDAAVETGTAIEINASLSRLDAPAEVIREGAQRGVTFVISTDAHAVGELDRARFGVAQARRGHLDVSLIANTWPYDRFIAWIDDIRDA